MEGPSSSPIARATVGRGARAERGERREGADEEPQVQCPRVVAEPHLARARPERRRDGALVVDGWAVAGTPARIVVHVVNEGRAGGGAFVPNGRRVRRPLRDARRAGARAWRTPNDVRLSAVRGVVLRDRTRHELLGRAVASNDAGVCVHREHLLLAASMPVRIVLVGELRHVVKLRAGGNRRRGLEREGLFRRLQAHRRDVRGDEVDGDEENGVEPRALAERAVQGAGGERREGEHEQQNRGHEEARRHVVRREGAKQVEQRPRSVGMKRPAPEEQEDDPHRAQRVRLASL